MDRPGDPKPLGAARACWPERTEASLTPSPWAQPGLVGRSARRPLCSIQAHGAPARIFHIPAQDFETEWRASVTPVENATHKVPNEGEGGEGGARPAARARKKPHPETGSGFLSPSPLVFAKKTTHQKKQNKKRFPSEVLTDSRPRLSKKLERTQG